MRETLVESVYDHIKSKRCSVFSRAYDTSTDKAAMATAQELVDNLLMPVLLRIAHPSGSRPHRADPSTWGEDASELVAALRGSGATRANEDSPTRANGATAPGEPLDGPGPPSRPYAPAEASEGDVTPFTKEPFGGRVVIKEVEPDPIPSYRFKVVQADKWVTISAEFIERMDDKGLNILKRIGKDMIRINDEVTYQIVGYDQATHTWKAVRIDD